MPARQWLLVIIPPQFQVFVSDLIVMTPIAMMSALNRHLLRVSLPPMERSLLSLLLIAMKREEVLMHQKVHTMTQV